MDDSGGEEDLFGQDDFDLPVNALHQLEQEAISLSQHGLKAHTNGLSTGQRTLAHKYVTSDVRMKDAAVKSNPPPSSDYGLDDDDDVVVDLNDPSLTFGRNDPPRFPSASVHQQYGAIGPGPAAATSATTDSRQSLRDLQAQIAALEADRNRLNEAVDALKNDAITKEGAIANLRSRNQRSVKEYEAKIDALQKVHLEESIKLKDEIKAAKKDRESIKTSNTFLEHDLAEERERLRRLKATGPDAQKKSNADAGTPKKAQSYAFRDGFDDDEIIVLSPSKARHEDKLGTPKAGQKRKRNAVASPSGSAPRSTSHRSPLEQEISVETETLALSRLTVKDERVDVLRKVLGHQDDQGQSTLEALGEYRLGDKSTTMSTLFLEALARLPPQEVQPPSVAVRSICLDLWEKCLAIKLFEPLPLVLGIFETMLWSENSKRQVLLFERVGSLVAKTTVVVAEPRVILASKTKSAAGPVANDVDSAIHPDDLRILKIFKQIAVSAALNPETATKLWQRAEFAFVMLMLHQAQPIAQLHVMLDVVATSSLDDSLGPRHGDPIEQTRQESDLIERLTSLLTDVRRDPSIPIGTWHDAVLDLRLHVLRTLRMLSVTEHGSRTLALNRTAIGRLSRFVCEQTTMLYATTPSPFSEAFQSSQPSSPPPLTRHERIVATINLTVRILYHLLQTHDIVLDEKLAVVQGGRAKLVIALSRIAFSERGLLEAGLETQVMDAANEILDLMVNAEEGEAIMQVMHVQEAGSSH